MKKDEWQFFRTKNNRISYHRKCLGCVHDCKQSFRVKVIYCPRYKKRGEMIICNQMVPKHLQE